MKWLIRKIKSLFKKKPRTRKPDIEPDRPTNSETEIPGFYPEAIFIDDLPKLKTHYSFGEWPEVYVVHFTAGWQKRTGRDFMKSFLKRGLCTDFLDKDGQVFQQRDGNRGGYHAGKSSFMGRSSVSRFAPGIEIACGGKLKEEGGKLVTWFKKEVPKENARYVTRQEGYVHTGWYEKYTEAQEESLAKFLAWQMRMGVKHIVGHDQIAPNRKSDPGGSLSMPLAQFVEEKVKPLI